MGYEVAAPDGSGSVTAYTLAGHEELRIELVAWTLVADASGGGHSGEVLFLSATGDVIARIPDWNDVPDAATVVYTYGIGLKPFCGIANDGGAIQNDLPDTVLTESCSIVVRSVDNTGTVIAGDSLTKIVLWVSAVGGAAFALNPDVPPYTSLPSDLASVAA